MITIYKSMESGVVKVDDVISGCWINVVDPTTDEIERLTLLDIPQDFVTSPLDIDERARSEREDDGTMLILLRIPYFQGAKTD
jgi:magnesium transporter